MKKTQKVGKKSYFKTALVHSVWFPKKQVYRTFVDGNEVVSKRAHIIALKRIEELEKQVKENEIAVAKKLGIKIGSTVKVKNGVKNFGIYDMLNCLPALNGGPGEHINFIVEYKWRTLLRLKDPTGLNNGVIKVQITDVFGVKV